MGNHPVPKRKEEWARTTIGDRFLGGGRLKMAVLQNATEFSVFHL